MKILFKFATIFFVICLINVGFVCSIPTRRKIPAWTGKPFASDLTAQDKNVFGKCSPA
ncbi:hypothetical protein GYMLUDRAFT_586702 [Collybiopsis luxurians FD-317 M1]|uniref:Uncharacterized protein n=1 Tax=Collybiopsis luxurians FD-317 M1 TaxID=944289 RepID=A0A0D0CQ08_9AGAR|nr:hypothetical protein GYMLUDRAFT_586702 [Collybiopsis luxurians FD-317 M1]